MNRSPALVPRCLLAALTTILLVAASAVTAVPSSAVVPRTPKRGPSIEALADYQGQTKCSPWAKPGTTAFANLLLRTYKNSRSLGIVRACNVGGQSEHKEGRAFDWGVSVHNARDRRSVQSVIRWLLKTDRHGNRFAMARRLGIQYMIWNRRIWGAYAASSGWRRYTGSNPHTDHVHFSLTWRGARKNTSFWGKHAVKPKPKPRPEPKPRPRPRPKPAPKPTPKPKPKPRPTAPRPPALREPSSPRTLPDGPALVDEQVNVAATARFGARTKGALQEGHRYLVEVSGTYSYGSRSRSVADAECSRTPRAGWSRDRSVRRDARGSDHLDLYLDGHDLYSESDSGDECDTDAHVYRWVYEAERDGRVPLRIWDPTDHANNSGRLSVRIVDLSPRRRLSWRVPARAAAGATSPGALEGGVDYQVTVSGTWRDGTGVTADAECSRTISDSTWRRDRSADPSDPDADDYDVLLDRDDVGADPAVDSGERCDAKHSYSFVWHADETRPVNLRVDDPGSHRDNSGGLRVAIAPYVAPAGPRRESVQVDSGRATAVSTDQVYPAGTRLRVTVEGAYLMRNGDDWGDRVLADAECTLAAPDWDWRAGRFSGWFQGRREPLGDVAVNGSIDKWWPADGSGDCDERRDGSNAYSRDVTTREEGRLSFVVVDDHHADNQGRLTVTVEPR